MLSFLNRLLPATLLSIWTGNASLAQTTMDGGFTAHDFVFSLPNGEDLPLAEFRGRPILIVNTASECGFKGQLGDLQTLQADYGDRGLVIVAVPSNDFGGQEPRSEEELTGYCQAQYGATYTITSQAHVKGKEAHPFYKWATEQYGITARPYWNFHKYLIGPDGQLASWFATPTRPISKDVRKAIEDQLKRMHEQGKSN